MSATCTNAPTRLLVGNYLDMVVLFGIAVWFRALGLQSSRFIGDDQWVIAASNTQGGFGELIRFGHTNPGFHVLVRLFSGGQTAGDSASFIAPAFIAGSLAAIVAYAVLLHLSANRFVAVLFGAILATSKVHADYSVRVKTYTVVVLLGLLILGWLVSRDRGPLVERVGIAAWPRFILGLLAYFTALTLGLWIAVYAVAALVAIFVCDHDPVVRKWVVRCAALGGLVSGAWLLFVRSNYGTEAFKEQFSGQEYLIPDKGLLQRPERTVTHFLRTTRIIGPDAPAAVSAVISLCIVVAVIYALVRRDRVATLTAALTAVFAAGAGFMGFLPYGTVKGWERLDLWLMPAYLVLLAALLTDVVHRLDLRRILPGRSHALSAGSLAVALVAGLLAFSDRPIPPGSAASAEFMDGVDSAYEQSTHLLAPNRRVLLAIAAYSEVIPVRLEADESSRGTRPVPADATVIGSGNLPSLDSFPATRIVLPMTRSFQDGELESAKQALRDAGYAQVAEVFFGRWDQYSIWQAPDPTMIDDG